MKKLLAILLTTLLLLSLVACGKDVEDPAGTETGTESSAPAGTTPAPTPDDDESDDKNADDENKGGDEQTPPDSNGATTVELNKDTKGIKYLGVRGILSDSQINCDHSGSGIEFVLQNKASTLTVELTSSDPCRFKVFVNGELTKNDLNEDFHEIFGEGKIELTDLPLGNITVRLVKITDQALATAELTKLTFTGTLRETAPADKDLYIEFIGGAETVGSGISAGDAYAGQDVTKAYSYLLAEALNADYSIISMEAVIADAVAAYELASPERDADAKYGFTRKADMVVVDLGSVDAADTALDANAFAEKYEELLTAIRAKNGEDCKLVCLYTASMGDLSKTVQSVCRQEMGGQQDGVYLCLRNAEGAEFVDDLKAVADAALAGTITERELGTAENGEGMKVNLKEDFVSVKTSNS
ncbi:MAG: hypothetical protein E7668_07370 [Ruminococcaceae bacterium]|nr:hypothetical protein [Oscillospiraceae bacterium]